MKILGIDVGRNSAWAFKNDTGTFKLQTILGYKKYIDELINRFEPELIVSCRPTFRPQVIAKQSKLIAIIELCCEENNIPFYEGIDSEMRKLAMNNGKATKEEIMEWAKPNIGEKTHDEADAYLFTIGMKNKCLKN